MLRSIGSIVVQPDMCLATPVYCIVYMPLWCNVHAQQSQFKDMVLYSGDNVLIYYNMKLAVVCLKLGWSEGAGGLVVNDCLLQFRGHVFACCCLCARSLPWGRGRGTDPRLALDP